MAEDSQLLIFRKVKKSHFVLNINLEKFLSVHFLKLLR